MLKQELSIASLMYNLLL